MPEIIFSKMQIYLWYFKCDETDSKSKRVNKLTLHNKWNFPLRISSVNVIKPAPVDLVTFTEEILNRTHHFFLQCQYWRMNIAFKKIILQYSLLQDLHVILYPNLMKVLIEGTTYLRPEHIQHFEYKQLLLLKSPQIARGDIKYCDHRERKQLVSDHICQVHFQIMILVMFQL